jgi:DNA-directed RNA polymerase subunit M/transcription elongation factor TFIIS
MSKLNWKNITQDFCPKCGNALIFEDYEDKVVCETEKDARHATCFIMSKVEYYKLRTKIGDKKVLNQFDHDNTEALNNL